VLFFKLLRAFAPLAWLLATQVGLYLVLRDLFAPRRDQARRRRNIIAGQLAIGLWLPIFMVSGKAGFSLPAALRWLAQPLLAYHMLCLPGVVLLGVTVSVAKRLHKRRLRALAVDSKTIDSIDSKPIQSPQAEPILTEEPLSEARRVFLSRAAIGLFGIAGIATAEGIHEAEAPPDVSRHDVFLKGLHPDLDGVTILQLSDVHSGMLMTEARMAAIARSAALLSPDLVVFTGDLLDMSLHAGPPFSRAFSSLHGKLGTFGILGNHDYYAGAGAAIRAVQDAGGVLLRNSGRRIERGKGTLWIGGIDDPMAAEAGGSVDPVKALRGAAPEECRVMLAHRPQLFDKCAAAGSSLVLSGHTHGGQLALSPAWSTHSSSSTAAWAWSPPRPCGSARAPSLPCSRCAVRERERPDGHQRTPRAHRADRPLPRREGAGAGRSGRRRIGLRRDRAHQPRGAGPHRPLGGQRPEAGLRGQRGGQPVRARRQGARGRPRRR